jgi:hypothetical protein
MNRIKLGLFKHYKGKFATCPVISVRFSDGIVSTDKKPEVSRIFASEDYFRAAQLKFAAKHPKIVRRTFKNKLFEQEARFPNQEIKTCNVLQNLQCYYEKSPGMTSIISGSTWKSGVC